MINRVFLLISLFILFSAASLAAFNQPLGEKEGCSQGAENEKAEKKEKEKKQDIFSCKHCDLMMSVVDPNQKCDVCRCDKTASECKGE